MHGLTRAGAVGSALNRGPGDLKPCGDLADRTTVLDD